MYAASYSDERSAIPVPDGYSGTMITNDEEARVNDDTESVKAPDVSDSASVSAGAFSGLFGSGITGIFKGGLFRDFTLGTEEILIIAAAAFLLFSGSGDIECAIMLLILLFIK